MLTTAEDIWSEIKNRLKQELSEDTYELWFKPTKAHSFNDNLFNVTVPNKFFSSWLEEHHKNRIETLLESLSEKSVKVNFIIDPEAQRAMASETKEDILEPLPDINLEQELESSTFNPKYVFQGFVVGPSNRFAHATAEAVANDPGRAYNPLFIYGGVGLGKTHLLQAIGNHIITTKPNRKILYVNSEKFTNELIESIRNDRMIEFHGKYRSLDVLLIDDIQFLAGKESTQEKFFHIFNTLYEARKQIVLTSDSTPKEIPTLEERLRSRFQWGVVADIQPPDLETRIAILRKKAERENFYVSDDIILFLASQIKSNIRELEGSLIRIVAFSSLTGTEMTVDHTKELLKDVIGRDDGSTGPLNIEDIQKIVCKHFNVDLRDMKGKKRTDAIAFPRQIAMYLTRNLTELSTTDIGNAFGGRDHTTVMYACEKIKNKISSDPYFNALTNKIINEVKGNAH